jgi:O-antigen/teichoic acid export membrane protein
VLRSKAGELARFAVSTNLSATISLVTKDSELLWVSLLRNPIEAGYYKLALALANMVQLPIDPLPQATYPELSRQVAKEKWEDVRNLLRQGSRIAGGYSGVVTIFLVLFGGLLIQLLYSREFLPAYPALVILLAGLMIANTFYWRRVALLALGRADIPVKVNLTLAGFKVAGILLFVPRYGFLASAALLAGFYCLGTLITVLKIRSLIAQHEAFTGTTG